MNAYMSYSTDVWYVSDIGYIDNHTTKYTFYGAHAVVVINK